MKDRRRLAFLVSHCCDFRSTAHAVLRVERAALDRYSRVISMDALPVRLWTVEDLKVDSVGLFHAECGIDRYDQKRRKKNRGCQLTIGQSFSGAGGRRPEAMREWRARGPETPLCARPQGPCLTVHQKTLSYARMDPEKDCFSDFRKRVTIQFSFNSSQP